MKIHWKMTIGTIIAGSSLWTQGADVKALERLYPIKDYSVTTLLCLNSLKNPITTTSKVYRSGKKERNETTLIGGELLISISNPEIGMSYTLIPSKKTYTSTPISVFMKADERFSYMIEELGMEVLDGELCEKFRVVTIMESLQGPERYVQIMWCSPHMKNMPVKTETIEPIAGNGTLFKDYDFSKPSDDLFTLPAGYKVDSKLQKVVNNAVRQAKSMAGKTTYLPPPKEITPSPVPSPSPRPAPEPAPIMTAVAKDGNPLQIKKWKYDQDTQKAEFEFTIVSEKADIFTLRPWALQQIRQVCNDEYVSDNPGKDKSLLGFSLVSEFDDPTFRVHATVHRIQPMSHSYDTATRTGALKVSIGKQGDANYAGAYKWALANIGVICSSKEVAVEAGQPLPEGAMYEILSEKTADDGTLEIRFKVIQ